MAPSTQTSLTNPLRIAELAAGGGMIGITFAPGKTQADAHSGAHARDLDADLDIVAAWNAAMVVTLVEDHELQALGISEIGEKVKLRHMEWEHWPIADFDVPSATFEAAWPTRSARVRQLLACGGRVLIHCKGGLGRAGMLSARLLTELGDQPGPAIAKVRSVRPGAIETPAQERWVAAGERPPSDPRASLVSTRDRARGALLGLAVGDAVGAAIEFSSKPRLAVIDDMIAGGPHRLERGQWTDDTAMALALADSLLATRAFNASDLMRRFLAWRDRGEYSCTGTCFDIGNQTSAALERFRRTGEAFAGPTGSAAGNGALMRLSPVAIRHWRDRDAACAVAAQQTRTTHGSPPTLAASRCFVDLLSQAIAGTPLPNLLASPAGSIEGGWRGLHRDEIEGSGYVVRSLQAALWAVARTTNFRSAVLLAANLGEDADTTAAIAGQLAGAVYGASAIPQGWRGVLAWGDRLEATADRLLDAGQTLEERLQALASFDAIFRQPGFVFGRFEPGASEDSLPSFGGYVFAEQAAGFYRVLYEYGWVLTFDWQLWRDTKSAQALFHDQDGLRGADADDLARVLTTCVRADRFCEGYLVDAFQNGLITRITGRALSLVQEIGRPHT